MSSIFAIFFAILTFSGLVGQYSAIQDYKQTIISSIVKINQKYCPNEIMVKPQTFFHNEIKIACPIQRTLIYKNLTGKTILWGTSTTYSIGGRDLNGLTRMPDEVSDETERLKSEGYIPYSDYLTSLPPSAM